MRNTSAAQAWLEQRRAEFDRAHSFNKVCRLETEDAGPGWARMRMPITPDVRNPRGAVHGGAISTLIDAAAGTSVAVTLPPGARIVGTVTLEVSFIERSAGDVLIAHARLLRAGRGIAFTQVEVRDAGERLVATGAATLRLAGGSDEGP